MKKILAVVLAIVMLSGILVVALAEGAENVEETMTEAAEQAVIAEQADNNVTEEAPAAEPAAVEEVPAQTETAEEVPQAEPAEAPVAEVIVVEEVPAEVTVVEEAPAAEVPAEETEEEAPAAEIPAEETPVEETPVQEAAAEETPVQNETVEEIPAQAEQAEEISAEAEQAEPAEEEVPAQEEPVEEAPAEEIPAEETPVQNEDAVEIPSQDELTEEVPAEETPAEEETEEEEEVSFTGIAFIPQLSTEAYVIGSFVQLHVFVEHANLSYTVTWERKEINNSDATWKTIPGEKDEVVFIPVTAESAYYEFRARIQAEDGTVIYTESVSFSVTAPQEEPAEEEAAEEEANEEAEEVAEEEVIEEVEEVEEEAIEEVAEEVTEEVTEEEVAEEEAAAQDEEEVIEDYETALGITTAPVFVYERNENGELVLDEEGNPTFVILGEGEIPAAFLRDENGELVLNAYGDPIPTQMIPHDAVKMLTIEDVLDPNRTIDIYASWVEEEPAFGGTVQFIAVLKGYDQLTYTLQWQQSSADQDWYSIEGANDTNYSVEVTEQNYMDYWRVQVTITGVASNIG